jgi:hypothetical protein
MTLLDLSAIGGFVSGLAVLVSLVFLFFQLRQIAEQIKQTQSNQKAAISQGRTNRMGDISLRMADPALAGAVMKGISGGEKFSELELFQLMNVARALFLNAEDTYYQHENGLLEREAFEGYINALKLTFMAPGFRLGWQLSRASYGAGFVRFMDKLLEGTPTMARAMSDQLAQWNDAMGALKPSP